LSGDARQILARRVSGFATLFSFIFGRTAPALRAPSAIRCCLFSLVLLLAACASGTDDPGVVFEDEPTPPVVVEAVSEAKLMTSVAPGENFDLSRWKLTLPSAAEITAAELSGGYQLRNVFYTDTTSGGMVFRCPNIAGTTATTHYSRTELREMRQPSGPASADANNWTLDEGGVLKATLRINHVSTTGETSKRGRVIIGQIHGDDSEVIRLYYDKKPDQSTGRIYAGLDSADNVSSYSPDIITRTGGIPLGETFSYEIRLQGIDLTVIIRRASGKTTTYLKRIDPAYAGENLYFKAGVYNQNNGGSTTDYVKATFLSLSATHG